MNHYKYEGPVLVFGRECCCYWKSETWAPTESKARSNLAYQFKKNCKLNAKSAITVPGKLTII